MIQITEANVGDILMFPSSGKKVRIDEVGAEYIRYTSETGDRFATQERRFDGVRLTDSLAISRFEENVTLGQTLNAAEYSALRKILSGELTPQERDEAIRVLGTTHAQQKELEKKILKEQALDRKQPPRLSDLIQNAEKRRDAEQRGDKAGIGDRGR